MLCTMSGYSWTAPLRHALPVHQIPTQAGSLPFQKDSPPWVVRILLLSPSLSCTANVPLIYACRVGSWHTWHTCSEVHFAEPSYMLVRPSCAITPACCYDDSLRMSGLSLAVSRSVRCCSFFLKCSSSSDDSACRMLQDALRCQSAATSCTLISLNNRHQPHGELRVCTKMKGASFLSGKEAYRASVHALL